MCRVFCDVTSGRCAVLGPVMAIAAIAAGLNHPAVMFAGVIGVGLGNGRLLTDSRIPGGVELDWWQQARVGEVTITCAPLSST